jgi:hypothetical protein
VKETLEALGMDPTTGIPAKQVALAYVDSVAETRNGDVLDTRAFTK